MLDLWARTWIKNNYGSIIVVVVLDTQELFFHDNWTRDFVFIPIHAQFFVYVF